MPSFQYDILTFNKFLHRGLKFKKAKQTRQKQYKTKLYAGGISACYVTEYLTNAFSFEEMIP